MKVWESFIDISHGWGVGTFILRFVVAILVGTMIGIDRERKNRGAGVKTHVIVCLGSALAMMTSQYVAVNFPYVKNDMTRIGAQVISGVDGLMCELSPQSIKDALVTLIHDKEACLRYAKAAEKKQFDSQKQLDRLLELMEE